MRLRFYCLLIGILCIHHVGAQIKLIGLIRGNGGRIIEYNTGSSSVTSPYLFPNNTLPWHNDLIQAKNGLLYGMVETGGAYGLGILFSYDPASALYNPLINFQGTINGASPYGSLIEGSDGLLYGMTESGGLDNMGAIFSYDIAANTITLLHSFSGTDGQSPFGSLLEANNGLLYGMTESGGANDMGTIFSFNKTTKQHTVLYTFNLPGSRTPYGSLIQATDDNLYGLVKFGGANGFGALFSITLSGAYTKKADFNWTNGAWPNSSLVQVNNKLYATTESGGANNNGVIFSYELGSTVITEQHNFIEGSGRSPYGKLLSASDNKLYGLTFRGGTEDKGVLFSFDPTAASFQKWVDFTGLNGMNPAASLVEFKSSAVLPLTLIEFKAKQDRNIVQLSWDVEAEVDIEKYEIERSTDGIQFYSLGFVNAKGSTSFYQYHYADELPISGNNYYRIKIHEKFKPAHYSPVRSVRINLATIKATVQPNPARGRTHLRLELPEQANVHLQLLNTQGIILKQWLSKTYSKGVHLIPIEITNLSSGSYLLMINAGSTKKTLTLLKTNSN